MRRIVNLSRGLSLLELVVAILILSLGTVAALRAASQSQRGIGQELPRVVGTEVLLNQAARLQLGASIQPTVRMGGYDWLVTAQSKPTQAGLIEWTLSAETQGVSGGNYVVYTAGAAP